MIKKKKKRAIYSIGEKNSNTFKEMKAFVWYNSRTNEEIQGFEMINDEYRRGWTNVLFKKWRGL